MGSALGKYAADSHCCSPKSVVFFFFLMNKSVCCMPLVGFQGPEMDVLVQLSSIFSCFQGEALVTSSSPVRGPPYHNYFCIPRNYFIC